MNLINRSSLRNRMLPADLPVSTVTVNVNVVIVCRQIFCGRCSSNNAPLPHFGFEKAVRVCNHCFMFELTPFTTDTYE